MKADEAEPVLDPSSHEMVLSLLRKIWLLHGDVSVAEDLALQTRLDVAVAAVNVDCNRILDRYKKHPIRRKLLKRTTDLP